MIVVLDRDVTQEQVQATLEHLHARGMEGRVLRSGPRPLIHIVSGPTRGARALVKLEWVEGLVPTSGPRVRRVGRRFYPYHFMGWGATLLVVLGMLVLLAGLFPPRLGEAVDLRSAPPEFRLPWYIEHPASLMQALPGWVTVVGLVGLLLLGVLLPVLDPGTRAEAGRERPRPKLPLLLLLALLAGRGAPAAQAQTPAGSSCNVCHGAEAQRLSKSVHARSGLGCIDCHGGVEGPLEVAAAHGAELRSLKRPLDAVESCGACHADLERMRMSGLRTDQQALYWTSPHGQALRADPSAPVATCSSCHSAHQVLPAGDPRAPVHPSQQVQTCGACHADPALMARYGLDPHVTRDYAGSVHGRALLEKGLSSSPSCTSCHGSHAATPPRVADVGRVCGHCHAPAQEQFEKSAHHAAGLKGELGECISCHGNHAIAKPTLDLLSGAENSLCGLCHKGDAGALSTARSMRASLAGLQEGIDGTKDLLAHARARGLVVDQAAAFLGEAQVLRARAATAAHTLSLPAVEDLVGRGRGLLADTEALLELESRALRDRAIFTAVFCALTVLFALLLLVYRRVLRGAGSTQERS